MKEETQNIAEPDNATDLPAWMQGLDAESLEQEVQEEMDTPVSKTPPEETSSHEDIPDWLRTVSTAPQATETPETEVSESPLPENDTEQKTPKKQVKSSTTKDKTPSKEKESSPKKTTSDAPRSKKQKPEPIISE